MGAVAAEGGKALVVGAVARSGGAGSVAAEVTNNPTVAAVMEAVNPEAEAAWAEGAGSAVAATGEAADPADEVASATSSRHRRRSGT